MGGLADAIGELRVRRHLGAAARARPVLRGGDEPAANRCAPWRAKRRRVVPGRRRRGRVAGVAKGRETRSRRRQHAERIRHAVKPFAKGVAKPEQLRRSELVAKPLPERGVPGRQRLSPRSESVRRQEPPDGFTSDTRHSCGVTRLRAPVPPSAACRQKLSCRTPVQPRSRKPGFRSSTRPRSCRRGGWPIPASVSWR